MKYILVILYAFFCLYVLVYIKPDPYIGQPTCNHRYNKHYKKVFIERFDIFCQNLFTQRSGQNIKIKVFAPSEGDLVNGIFYSNLSKSLI